MFDPRRHEAIAVEAGAGADGSIMRVHRTGWERADGYILRPAMVTVLKGSTEPGTSTHSSMADKLDRHPARPRRRRKPTHVDPESYNCPFGIPGCSGDCPGCSPIEEDLVMDFQESSD